MSQAQLLFVLLLSLLTGSCAAFALHPAPTGLRRRHLHHHPSSAMTFAAGSPSWRIGGIRPVITLLRGGAVDVDEDGDDELSETESEYDGESSDSGDDTAEDETGSDLSDGEEDINETGSDLSDSEEYVETDEEDGANLEAGEDVAALQDDESEEAKLERSMLYATLSSQARNMGLTTALWASLMFDTVLNTSKRSQLFPMPQGASLTLLATLLPTALLASGFGLATVTSFLLWRDLDVRADMVASDDGTSDKGDAFLSLSSGTDDCGGASAELVTGVRVSLYLSLFLFGVLSLAAHGGQFLAADAPFLGMSGTLISVHNLLTCFSAFMREVGGLSGLTKWVLALPRKLLSPEDAEQGHAVRKSSDLMRAVVYRMTFVYAWICVVRRVAAIRTTANMVEATTKTRKLALHVASIARLALFGDVCWSLNRAAMSSRAEIREHPFFSVLGGMLGFGSLAVCVSALLDSTITLSNLTGAFPVLIVAVVSAYTSASKIASFVKG